MDSKIQDCKTLEELFELWKQTHEIEENYKCDFGNIAKSSFCPDGKVDEESFGNEDKILFIAKEANCGRNHTENLVYANGVSFWLKDCVEGTGTKSNFSDRLAMMANAYYEDNYVFNKEQKQNYNNLRYTALINLNKRGGYSYCNHKYLTNYVDKYSKYIAKQIELLAPNLIVCCSYIVYTLFNSYIKVHLSNNIKNVKVISVFHPSYHYISDENYLRTFECALSEKPPQITKTDESTDVKRRKKGVIINTNLRYEDSDIINEILDETFAKVRVFSTGKNRKFNVLKNMHKGDYIFYYHNTAGIIAVGEITDKTSEYPEINLIEKSVKMRIKPVITADNEYIGCPVNSNFREIVKSDKGNSFRLNRTDIRPYLWDEEIDRAIEYLETKIQN